MVTPKVIKEIYKKYTKPPKSEEDLNIPYFLDLLREHHNLVYEEGEIYRVSDPDNLFGRMLVSRLTIILEFEKYVAFVFDDHILFFDKYSNNMSIHFKPETRSFLSRLFGKK